MCIPMFAWSNTCYSQCCLQQLITSIQIWQHPSCYFIPKNCISWAGPLTLLCFIAKLAFRWIWIILFPFFKNFLCCVAPYDDIINISHVLQDNYEMYLLFYSIIEPNPQAIANLIFLNVYWFQHWFTYHSGSLTTWFFCLCKHPFSSKTEVRQFSLI